MANQQIFPNSTYPLTGDIQSAPGDPSTTVVAIQSIPVSTTHPTEKQVLTSISNVWTPAGNVVNNASIEINGTSVSDDYWVFISRKDTEVQVNSTYPANGFPILVAGSPANTF